MYKFDRKPQVSLDDFDQVLGMKMNKNNRWVKKAELIPWEKIEEKYAKLFPSKTGMPAKPLRVALGALLKATTEQRPLSRFARHLLADLTSSCTEIS